MDWGNFPEWLSSLMMSPETSPVICSFSETAGYMSLDHSPSCGNKFSRENFCLPRSKLGQTNNFLVVLFLTNEKYTKV